MKNKLMLAAVMIFVSGAAFGVEKVARKPSQATSDICMSAVSADAKLLWGAANSDVSLNATDLTKGLNYYLVKTRDTYSVGVDAKSCIVKSVAQVRLCGGDICAD